MRCGTALTASLVLLLALGSPAVAQRSPTPNPGEPKAKTLAKPKPATKVETKQEAKPAPQPTPSVVMPDAEKIVLLVRTTSSRSTMPFRPAISRCCATRQRPAFATPIPPRVLVRPSPILPREGGPVGDERHQPAIDRGSDSRSSEGHAQLQGLFSDHAGADQFRDALSIGRRPLAAVRHLGAAVKHFDSATAGAAERERRYESYESTIGFSVGVDARRRRTRQSDCSRLE